MKFRIKEVEHDEWCRYSGQWKKVTYFYPQYRRFFFWCNFKEWYRGVKWMRRWTPQYRYREEAEQFIKNITK